MEFDLAAIIVSIGTIITAFLSYNQYTKNKETDFKIETWKKKEEKKSEVRNDNIAKIGGQLYRILYAIKADRVYIVQPHPLINNLYISISLEADIPGVTQMKYNVQNMPIDEIALFASELAKRDIMIYKNVDSELKDIQAKALFRNNGAKSVIIKKLFDKRYDWIGSIFCEFFDESKEFDYIYARSLVTEVAESIQFILPEYK